ncbi:MAG: cupredoxin domain-containing protein [Thermomicrobiales bacterium]|nr:cupredoxin domain-containing protein [Thermomicrobiales bacterium]
MGSVQRLATMVIFGLVALSTILFLYLGDENNRIDQKAELHQEAAIERATNNYIALCLRCHGPAGEGYLEPGSNGLRVGAPLGGVNQSLNQEGVNASGTPWPGGVDARAQIIHDTIYNGLRTADGEGYRMPAFGGDTGSLTDAQIDELVLFVQHVDWNTVFNHAVEVEGGYPTPPPAEATKEPEEETGGESGGGAGSASLVIESHDIFFDPTTLEIPANTDVTIELPNLGAAPHNFAIDELGISIDLAAGSDGSVVINAPPGEYEFYCNVPGHKDAGMHGILVVTEGYELPTAAGASGEAAAEGDGDEAAAADDGASEEATADGESAGGAEFTVVSHDIYFEPAELTVPANTDVTFILPNEGAAPHNFTIDELDISVDQAGGETHEVVINAPPGEYEFYCNVPGHKEAGMHGILTVE